MSAAKGFIWSVGTRVRRLIRQNSTVVTMDRSLPESADPGANPVAGAERAVRLHGRLGKRTTPSPARRGCPGLSCTTRMGGPRGGTVGERWGNAVPHTTTYARTPLVYFSGPTPPLTCDFIAKPQVRKLVTGHPGCRRGSVHRLLSRAGSVVIPLCGLPGGVGRAVLPLLDLAPGGVCQAVSVTRDAGALLPHRFTLACAVAGHRRSVLCCTFLRVTPTSSRQHPALWSPDLPRHGQAVPRPPTRVHRRLHSATTVGSWHAPGDDYSWHKRGGVGVRRRPGRCRGRGARGRPGGGWCARPWWGSAARPRRSRCRPACGR